MDVRICACTRVLVCDSAVAALRTSFPSTSTFLRSRSGSVHFAPASTASTFKPANQHRDCGITVYAEQSVALPYLRNRSLRAQGSIMQYNVRKHMTTDNMGEGERQGTGWR